MKFTLIVVSLGFLGTSLFGQTDPIDAFFEQYREVAESSHIDLGGWALDLAINNTDDEEAKSLLSKITKLQVLTLPNEGVVNQDDVLALRTSALANRFEELMQIREDGDLINIYLREDGDAITDVLLLVEDEEELIFVNLKGSFRFEDLKELDFDLEGMDSLEHVPDERGPRP